jgi:hypothetical protein
MKSMQVLRLTTFRQEPESSPGEFSDVPLESASDACCGKLTDGKNRGKVE